MLYELLTRHPPFAGDSPVAVAHQHVQATAPPPSSSNPDVPPDLDAIVMKSMAKNPANRYQTAAEMRADLVRAINGRPVSAEPILNDDDHVVIGNPAATAGYRVPTHSAEPRRGLGRTAGWIMLAVAVLLVVVLSAVITARLLSGP
jgi:serine/threonine-protein kinase